MKKSLLLLLLVLGTLAVSAQPYDHYRQPVGEVRNVIVMIPDGTSSSVLSIARWFQRYNNPELTALNLDPLLCGVVGSFSPNSPIPDSAASMSAYMTGMPTTSGFISVYPVADARQDFIEVDPQRAYMPLATLMEAAKYEKGMATGLVVTQTFCHATPAACASHHHSRNSYATLAAQIAANNVDVVIGGGRSLLPDNVRAAIVERGVTYIDDGARLREYKGSAPLWALVADDRLDYEIDRDDATMPSLAENTRLAIDLLSKGENGFFLMVEGSLVDAAAHANDPGAILHEMLAFDRAVGVALEFAKRDGNTAIVIMPDHGNAAMTFGKPEYKNYTTRGLEDGFKAVSGYRASAERIESAVKDLQSDGMRKVFADMAGIELTDEEVEMLVAVRDRKESDYMKVALSKNLHSAITSILTSRTPYTFPTGNHTSEDVFLAAYHPKGDLPVGRNTNSEINAYIADLMALEMPLGELTRELFAPHTELFGNRGTITAEEGQPAKFSVKHGAAMLTVTADSSVIEIDGEPQKLRSVVVYSPKTGIFYMPREILEML